MDTGKLGWSGLAIALGLVAGCGPGYIWGLHPVQAGSVELPTVKVSSQMSAQSTRVYDFTLNDIDGKPVSLSQFRGKVLLLVNTASFCGNTPQYADLQAMYEQYQGEGLEILAFPEIFIVERASSEGYWY